MKALQVVAERSSGAVRRGVRQSGSLLPARIDGALRAVEDAGKPDDDPVTALRNTIEAIWKTVTQAVSEPALEPSRRTVRALLARRELYSEEPVSYPRSSAVVWNQVPFGPLACRGPSRDCHSRSSAARVCTGCSVSRSGRPCGRAQP